jgi:multisubunit Na+/H+ antiporter MnhC subunit
LIIVGAVTKHTALAQSLVITLIVIEVVIMVAAGGVILCVFRRNKTIDVRRLRNLKG